MIKIKRPLREKILIRLSLILSVLFSLLVFNATYIFIMDKKKSTEKKILYAKMSQAEAIEDCDVLARRIAELHKCANNKMERLYKCRSEGDDSRSYYLDTMSECVGSLAARQKTRELCLDKSKNEKIARQSLIYLNEIHKKQVLIDESEIERNVEIFEKRCNLEYTSELKYKE